jgi:hypothetical protein
VMEDVVSIWASFYGTHEKRPFERKRLKWCNFKIDLKEMLSVCMDWINFSQERNKWRTIVNTVIKLPVA